MDIEGYWKVVSLPDLDDGYLGLSENPHVELSCDSDGYYSGDFQFGAQDGDIWGVVEEIGKKPYFIFSFIGSDEGTEINGAGIARLKGKNRLTGKMFYHRSDALAFEWER